MRKRIIGNDVLLGTQESADALLLDVAVVLFEGIRKAESDHWEARNVVRVGLVLFVEIVLLLVLTMNVEDTGV